MRKTKRPPDLLQKLLRDRQRQVRRQVRERLQGLHATRITFDNEPVPIRIYDDPGGDSSWICSHCHHEGLRECDHVQQPDGDVIDLVEVEPGVYGESEE